MKISEFIMMDIDIDILDPITDELLPAYVGPMGVTEAGARAFADVLDLEIEVDEEDNMARLVPDTEDEELWCKKLRRISEFFWACAGYIESGLWDKYFFYPDEEV